MKAHTVKCYEIKIACRFMFFFTLIFSETKDNLFDLLGRPTDLAVSNGAGCNRDKSDISISSRPPNIPLIHASAKAVVNLTSKLKNIEDIFLSVISLLIQLFSPSTSINVIFLNIY